MHTTSRRSTAFLHKSYEIQTHAGPSRRKLQE